jgi:hypothetical protein
MTVPAQRKPAMQPRSLATIVVGIIGLTLAFGEGAARADQIVLGSDYFTSAPGTQFDFGSGIGVVPLKGLPIGPGSTDAVMQRLQDATLGGPGIPIQITALSLQSIAPVNIGGNFYSVFITLDPKPTAVNSPHPYGSAMTDSGLMVISGTAANGGTFSAMFDEYLDVNFVPIKTGATIAAKLDVQMYVTNGVWGPSPPPGTAIVSGIAGNQYANRHTGLSASQADFFVTTEVSEVAGNSVYVIDPPPPASPEPGTLGLACLAAAGLASYAWRRTRPHKIAVLAN